MRNTVRRQREGLRGGGEAPPPRVARTGLGAGLGRAGRAPEGAGLGRAERAPNGKDLEGWSERRRGGPRSAACAGRGGGGRRWRERAVWRVGGRAGSGWSGLSGQDPRSTRLAC